MHKLIHRLLPNSVILSIIFASAGSSSLCMRVVEELVNESLADAVMELEDLDVTAEFLSSASL